MLSGAQRRAALDAASATAWNSLSDRSFTTSGSAASEPSWFRVMRREATGGSGRERAEGGACPAFPQLFADQAYQCIAAGGAQTSRLAAIDTERTRLTQLGSRGATGSRLLRRAQQCGDAIGIETLGDLGLAGCGLLRAAFGGFRLRGFRAGRVPRSAASLCAASLCAAAR